MFTINQQNNKQLTMRSTTTDCTEHSVRVVSASFTRGKVWSYTATL